MKFPRFQRTVRTSLAIAMTLCASTNVWADNWPHWRGPLDNGICSEKNIPTTWSRSKNVAWRLALPGLAGASPVVWDDRIFLSSVDGNELVLFCVNTDGQQLWRRRVGTGNKNVRGDEGNSASPSPVTDGKHVWSMMATGAIACYDMQGREVWKMNLEDRYGKFKNTFGMASTPIVHGDRLFLQLIHGVRNLEPTSDALVVALDKLTGKEIWKQERVTHAYDENKHSYASPILYQDGKTKFLITHGADYTIAHQLSDGSEIWRCGDLNPQDNTHRKYHPTLRFVASPAAVPGMVVIPTAKNGPVVVIRPNFRGDVTKVKSAHIWTRANNTPDVPSPLIHDNLVYLCRENGVLLCLEAQTGRELYQKRIHSHRHRASPVYADGKIYLTARDGRVTVVKTGRKFEILARNDLNETISASPAISNGTIYLRSFEALWAIRNR
jgi:outer membrane protein assembly factor BamB